jgi:hypothetical protein
MEGQDWGGPYLAAAVFCSEVRVDPSGMHSIINIIDEVTASGPRPRRSDTGQVHLYLRFLRGDFAGELPISLFMVFPDESTDTGVPGRRT